MKKHCFLIFLSTCLYTTSFAQFSEVTFPNEMKPKDIKQQKLNGISCQLIKRQDSPKKLYKSTSFFISKNFLLTSEHNLKSIKSKKVIKLGIFPSRKGNKKPYGSIIIDVKDKDYYRALKRNFTKLRWRKRPHDMALIYLPDSVINNNKSLQNIHYLPIFENSDELKKGDTIYCAGYPATDIYAGQNIMTMISSTVKKVHKNHFSHRLKTHRGNSGSPIMIKKDGQFYVIGVNSIFKHGTWLNRERQTLIKQWMNELLKSNTPSNS